MPLLSTKLYIPPIRPRERVVPRPRLIERLNEGPRSGRKRTLISAPAGFGKTSLVSQWVEAMGRATPYIAAMSSGTPPLAAAWLSLETSSSRNSGGRLEGRRVMYAVRHQTLQI